MAWHRPFLYSFFFQAEDGIRDHCVTGVQTCALPISGPTRSRRPSPRSMPKRPPPAPRTGPRSEERRVGKEWRRPWALSAKKKTGWLMSVRRDEGSEGTRTSRAQPDATTDMDSGATHA